MADQSEGPSELGALGDLYGALYTLTADTSDVSGYTQVLTDALGTAFPPGMLEVSRARSLGDRAAGRLGKATRLTIHGDTQELELRSSVRGVVISRRTVAVDVWLQALAEELRTQASRAASSREALRRLLGG